MSKPHRVDEKRKRRKKYIKRKKQKNKAQVQPAVA
jgi:hypothetical protein